MVMDSYTNTNNTTENRKSSFGAGITMGPRADDSFPTQRKNSAIDEELERLIASHKTRIRVVGCGGGGNNTINRISEVGIKGIETIAMNTDAQDLLYTNADKKVLLGKQLTQGLGAWSNPKIGE